MIQHRMMRCDVDKNLNTFTWDLQTLMQTLKNEHNCCETSMKNEMIATHHVRHIGMPIGQTINGICMQCNIL